MKRTVVFLIATLVLGAGALLATASPSTLKFTSKTTSQTATFTSIDDVLQGAKKIGTDKVVCNTTGANTASCKVTLTLDFEPQSRLLAPALALGFQGLADRMVDDFVRIADAGAEA